VTFGPPLYPVFIVPGLPQTLAARVIDFRSCRCRTAQLGLPKVFLDPPGGGHRRHDTECLTHAVATCARMPSSGFIAVGTLGFWGPPFGDGAGRRSAAPPDWQCGHGLQRRRRGEQRSCG